MTIFFIGLCGALLGLGLTALGAAAGWMAANALRKRPGPVERRENRAAAEEQRAFRQLQNYSAQQAYGLLEGLEADRQ